MKPRNIIITLLTVSYITATAAIRPIKLTCEYLENPMTIDARHPRLSWINIADKLSLPPGKDDVANSRQLRSGNYVIDCL